MKSFWQGRGWLKVVLQVAGWNLLFSMPYLLKPTYSSDHVPPHNAHYDYKYIINCLSWIGLFYLNMQVLIPRLFYRKRYGAYVLSLVAVMVLLFFIDWVSFILLLKGMPFHVQGFAVFFIFPCVFMLALSTAFRMVQDRLYQEKIAKERETENLKTELSFLRSQVSPHFMFNVLNNMVALARKKSDVLEPSLIKLSSLLRYMLYETDEEKVSLSREIDYLQSYIDLQQQRFGKNVVVKASLSETDAGYAIEPMLLIPFVENAFKHGTGLVEGALIDIKLTAKNDVLHFTVMNKYDPAARDVKDKTSGIGLTNVTRRLNLLYGADHTLLITKRDEDFTVSLQLNLH